ncbi:MAG TPA: hypothetical protein ENI92_01330, partial [Bacteroidetes bacterium]|nr:hypothetical protein [Bacteroidota bacterium]
MKTKRERSSVIAAAGLSTLLGLLLFCLPARSQESGAEWLRAIDAAERIPHATGVLEQIITTSGGSERTLTIRYWSADNDSVSLMLYTDPPRVRGDKILL